MTNPERTAEVVKEIIEKLEGGKTNDRLRHYVELDARGRPTDKTLCGYLWDQLHVPHNGTICMECVEELRRRRQG